MPSEIEFLILQDILQIHADQLARYGGQDGLRDEKALESAVSQPQASFGGEYLHLTLFDMAAAYAYHIAQNQPFVDGNKRTGLAAALVFLEFNGFEVLDQETKLAEAVENFPGGKADKRKKEFGMLLKKLSRAIQ